MTQPSSPDPFVSNGSNDTPRLEASEPSISTTASSSPSTGTTSAPFSIPPLSQSTLLERTSRPQTRRLPSSASEPHLSSSRRSQSRETSSLGDDAQHSSDYRTLIYQSFAPRVAVFASPDTDEFIRRKGFRDGLCELLRPYGEKISGKVTIRDSTGYSRSHETFGVRFVSSLVLQNASSSDTPWDANPRNGGSQYISNQRSNADAFQAVEASTRKDIVAHSTGPDDDASQDPSREPGPSVTSDYYRGYLRRILTSTPLAPYETFSHPAACIIAVSSHNPAPIDTLRQLYAQTSRPSNGRMPEWLNTEFLRYYILIHDDESDDLTKSTALFDLMKRHFGLHCHLLRLRSSIASADDRNVVLFHESAWLSAEDDLARDRLIDHTEDFGGSPRYIPEPDANAISIFLREMVVQSLIPFMESRMVTWNDQVASRRRGISGRFVSLSKRFAGFGTSKSSSPSGTGGQASGGNYNSQEGFYPPNTPEATMRQLADYAFMLRDWKLAYTTYDILRADFAQDKAWLYHAAANEMGGLTSLLNAHNPGMRYRPDLVEQMLETATYSYLTRCAQPWGVIRCLTVATELLRSLGSAGADDSRRWGSKLLECEVLRPLGQAMTLERIADCFEATAVSRSTRLRKRQAALWNVLSSECWLKLDKPELASHRLDFAKRLYSLSDEEEGFLPFQSMGMLWSRLIRKTQGENAEDSESVLIDTSIGQPVQLERESRGHKRQSTPYSRPTGFEDVDSEGFTSQDAGGLSYEYGASDG